MRAINDLLRIWPGRVVAIDGRLRVVASSVSWPGLSQARGAEAEKLPEAEPFLRQVLFLDGVQLSRVMEAIQDVAARRLPHWQMRYVVGRGAQRVTALVSVVPWPEVGNDVVLLSVTDIHEPVMGLAGLAAKDQPERVPTRGLDAIRSLVQQLAWATGAKYGFACRRLETVPTRAEMMVLWDGEQFCEPFEFFVAETPCERVYQEQETIITQGAHQLYPRDQWLSEHRVSAYISVALKGRAQKILGHIGIMHNQPLENAGYLLPAVRWAADQVVAEWLRELPQADTTDTAANVMDVLDVVDFALWIGKPDMSQWLYANRAASDLFGIPREVLYRAPQSVLSRVHPYDLDRVRATWLSSQVGLHFIEFRYLQADQSERWVQAYHRRTYDSSGRPYCVGWARDITIEKLFSEAAQESLATLRALMRAAPDGIVVIDEYGRIEEVNPAVERMFGYESYELIGQEAGILAPPPHRHEHGNYVRRYVEGGKPKIIGIGRQEMGQRKDGSCFPIRLAVGEARSQTGRKFVGILQDISLLKQREEELIHARRVAEEANQAKSRFLAMVSHELRTPLNGLLGMNTLLANTPLSAEQRRYLDHSLACGKMLLELINNLLDLTKMEAGKFSLEVTAARLDTVVVEVCNLFRAAAEEKRIQLRSELEPDTSRTVMCDPNRIRQVLINLVSNAIKFTHQGEVVVRLQSQAVTPNALRVRCIVQDTGVGIDPAHLHRIFAPFEQVDQSTTRRYGGTGLGLAICKELVERMGGTIEVESEPGVGSTFRIEWTFPLAAESEDTVHLAPDTVDAEYAPFPSLSVLLAEDNSVNQLFMQEILQHMGCRVTVVSNGLEAVQKFSQQAFDLIFMDVQMPELDGLAATQQIRALEEVQGTSSPVCIIALTAHATSEHLELCRSVGMDDFLSKPVSPEAIRAILQQCARRRK